MGNSDTPGHARFANIRQLLILKRFPLRLAELRWDLFDRAFWHHPRVLPIKEIKLTLIVLGVINLHRFLRLLRQVMNDQDQEDADEERVEFLDDEHDVAELGEPAVARNEMVDLVQQQETEEYARDELRDEDVQSDD